VEQQRQREQDESPGDEPFAGRDDNQPGPSREDEVAV
jgi:hypothetical protein